jgi:prephenate dehydratase
VQSGSVSEGVVPFENSAHGSVVETLDLFADTKNIYSDICVTSETYIDVHHCLVGRVSSHSAITSSLPHASQAQSIFDSLGLQASGLPQQAGIDTPVSESDASPLQSLGHIRHIYSHPQGLGQCERFLSRYLPGVERHEVKSTSQAAEIASKDPTNSSVAICSEAAARKFGLDVLGRDIQDYQDNATRFFVLKKADSAQLLPTTAEKMGHRSKTLVSFTVDHRRPKALAETLLIFGTYGLNLTSINSRPSDKAWNYNFFIEFQGSRYADPEGRVKEAFAELDKATTRWRWLGSWEDELRRRDARSPFPA